MIRTFLFLAVLIALLAACGGQPTAAPTSAPAAPVATSAPATTSAPASTDAPAATSAPAPTDAPAATAVAGAAGCDAGKRLFEHPTLAYGAVCIPENPTRVAALEPMSYDILFATGRKPVAATGYIEAVIATTYPALAYEANGITNLGYPVNLELLVAAKPDIIIAVDFDVDAATYEKMSAIAPTVVFKGTSSGHWKKDLELVADALGLQDEAAQLFTDYQARLQTFRETVGKPEDISVSIVRVQPDDQIMMNLVNSFPSNVVADAGLGRPESQSLSAAEAQQQYNSDVGAQISLEKAELADADIIIVWGAQASADQLAAAEERWQALNANPVWASLSAVQAGNVHRVGSHWVGWAFYAAHAVIDDLFRHVAEVDPASVAPNPLLRQGAAQPADPAALQVLEETAEHRLIKHSLGETKVPLQPQRVVTLQDQNALLPLFELGFTDVVGSVGAVKDDGSTYYRRTQNYDTSKVVYVGEYGAPNFEQIAALKPDLIVGGQYEVTRENYDLLSRIAPTVVVEQFTRPTWAHYDDFALLVNKTAESQALRARLEARLAEVKAQLKNPGDITVSLFYVEEPGKLNAEADVNLPYHIVFDRLGLGQTPAVAAARAND
jgi:iron complex transport system substrate-binding protein